MEPLVSSETPLHNPCVIVRNIANDISDSLLDMGEDRVIQRSGVKDCTKKV